MFFPPLIGPDVAVNTSGEHIFLCFGVINEKMLSILEKFQLYFLSFRGHKEGSYLLIKKKNCSVLHY